jgi:hypothetical protein
MSAFCQINLLKIKTAENPSFTLLLPLPLDALQCTRTRFGCPKGQVGEGAGGMGICQAFLRKP